MRILLLGDYSNVHATLAPALRSLGHSVTLASDGDAWKDYERDIDLRRKGRGLFSSIRYIAKLIRQFRHFRHYDIVQIINPEFLPLKAEHIIPFYHFLRRNNRRIVMGAFGMDRYYATACLNCSTFRYSDFNIGTNVRHTPDTEAFKKDWIDGAKGRLNTIVANNCDAIVAGLYEYYAAYADTFGRNKLYFIPFPIVPKQITNTQRTDDKINFFIGIQETRDAYKGTDIMLKALERIHQTYPDACNITIARSLPFKQYTKLLNKADVLLDQLYSYTPAMNALEAMSRGIVVVSGGEPENYDIIQENELHPIINVEPTEESVYNALDELIKHRDERLSQLKQDSIKYITRHHDHIKVAKQFETLFKRLLELSKKCVESK